MRLTKRRLEAIVEALIFRTAGETGDSDVPIEDYEKALSWALQEQAKRLTQP